MGISQIFTLPGKPGLAVASQATAKADGLPIDFAALLDMQSLSANPLADKLNIGLGDQRGTRPMQDGSLERSSESEPASMNDPALVGALFGNPLIQPPAQAAAANPTLPLNGRSDAEKAEKPLTAAVDIKKEADSDLPPGLQMLKDYASQSSTANLPNAKAGNPGQTTDKSNSQEKSNPALTAKAESEADTGANAVFGLQVAQIATAKASQEIATHSSAQPETPETSITVSSQPRPATPENLPVVRTQVEQPAKPAANIAGEATEAPVAPAQPQTFGQAVADAVAHRQAAQESPPSIATPLTNKAWPEHFGDKVVWLARHDQQTAQINITPAQLGPIQINISLNGDQANAVFTSPHPEVRQAIEAALPQLREMLSAAGINLGDANVGAHTGQQQNHEPPASSANTQQSRHENAILPANENAGKAIASPALHRGRGLVDLFA